MDDLRRLPHWSGSGALLCSLLLTLFSALGCATKLPDITYHFDGQASIRIDKIVRIDAKPIEPTGRVQRGSQMIAAGGIFVSVPTGGSFDPRFSVDDQRKIADYLGEELARLGVVKSFVLGGKSTEDEPSIELEFIRAEFRNFTLSYLLELRAVMTYKARVRELH